MLASIFGLTGVALGAFGAHALKPVLSSDAIGVFETAVRYQLYHTFALFVASSGLRASGSRWFLLAARFLSAGVVLFSGSLYLLATTASVAFGYATPIGGVCLLTGWASLAYGFWKDTGG